MPNRGVGTPSNNPPDREFENFGKIAQAVYDKKPVWINAKGEIKTVSKSSRIWQGIKERLGVEDTKQQELKSKVIGYLQAEEKNPWLFRKQDQGNAPSFQESATSEEVEAYNRKIEKEANKCKELTTVALDVIGFYKLEKEALSVIPAGYERIKEQISKPEFDKRVAEFDKKTAEFDKIAEAIKQKRDGKSARINIKEREIIETKMRDYLKEAQKLGGLVLRPTSGQAFDRYKDYKDQDIPLYAMELRPSVVEVIKAYKLENAALLLIPEDCTEIRAQITGLRPQRLPLPGRNEDSGRIGG